ncbi:MAG: hypothetical protein ACRELB_12965 [Polyangiaceae bacterium]
MLPQRPCSNCNSTRFGHVQDLAFDLYTDAKVSFGQRVRQHFEALVCVQCGATQLFASANLLMDVKHAVVHAERPAH